MRDFSALPLPAKPLGGRAAGREKLRLIRHKPRPDRGVELLAAVCVTLLFILCGAVYFCSGLLSSNKFHENISVNSVVLAGMTSEEAADKFAGLKATVPASLKVFVGSKTWTIEATDINAHYNVDETLSRAWQVGRDGTTFHRLGEILSLSAHPQQFETGVVFDKDKLMSYAKQIAQESYVPGSDAKIQFQPMSKDVFTITEGTEGSAVDVNNLYTLLKDKLEGGGSTVTAQTQAVQPGVTAAMLREQTQLLATCTTGLTEDSVRNNNIKLAATAVNGAVIYPGGELSFNTLTGERSTEKGYVDAPAISNGKLVDAPGGGVCQVATTIYVAALQTELDVVERHHHTWKMSYVEAGLDATVDWASKKDLRLGNSTQTPVYLVVRMDETNHMITANLYGLPAAESISVSPVVLRTVMPGEPVKVSNPKAKIGADTVLEESIPGYSVDVFRIFTDKDNNTEKVLVSQDVYEPVNGKIEIGTKAPAGSK